MFLASLVSEYDRIPKPFRQIIAHPFDLRPEHVRNPQDELNKCQVCDNVDYFSKCSGPDFPDRNKEKENQIGQSQTPQSHRKKRDEEERQKREKLKKQIYSDEDQNDFPLEMRMIMMRVTEDNQEDLQMSEDKLNQSNSSEQENVKDGKEKTSSMNGDN